MLKWNHGLQHLAVASAIALSFSTTAFATTDCGQVTATNAEHIENGLAEKCNYFSVCSTGDGEVIGYTWTSSSTETTLYTDGSGAGYKDQPEQCKVIDPNSCEALEETLASLKEKGLAEDCGSYSICSTGDGETLGYSWLAKYSKAKVYVGGDDLGYSEDPRNCAIVEAVDIAITSQSDTSNIIDGQTFNVTANINNIGTIDSTEITTINAYVALIDGCSETDCAPSGNIEILEATSDTLKCDSDSYSVSCSSDPLAAGENVQLVITARATHVGPVALNIWTSTEDDTNNDNNSAFLNLDVSELSEEVTYIEPAMNVVSKSDMPNTENAAFTSDGALYVAQAAYGGSIYRISRDANGDYTASSFITGPDNCRFTGMTSSGITLYASCQTSTPETYLMKIELIDDMLEVISKKLDIDHGLANGMAVGPDGSIYISDSDRVASSVFKVEIVNPDTFEIEVSPWLGTEYTSDFPNGVQIEGNTMYLAERTKIHKIEITNDGPGKIEDFYTPSGNILIDDFTVTPQHLAVSVIDYFVAIMGGSGSTGHTVILDKTDGSNVLQEIAANQTYQPSSVVYDSEGVFGPNALFVTDYFLGGLYIIEADQVVYAQ